MTIGVDDPAQPAGSGPGSGVVSPGWLTIALILSGGVAAALSIVGVSAILPQIERSLASTDAERMLVKLLVGVGGAAMVLGAPLTGFLSDRIQLKWVLVGNYLLFAAAGVSGLFLDSLWGLVVVRFLVGVAAAGAVTASIIIINKRMSPAIRSHWFGIYAAVSALSPIAFQPVIGLLAEIDWHWAFSLYAIGLPFAALSLRFRGDPGDVIDRADRAQEEPLLRWLPKGLTLLACVMGFITFIPIIYAPFLLRDLGITSPSSIAFVLMADTATAATLGFLFGVSRKRLSERAALMIAYSATAVGGLVVATATAYQMVMVGMAVSGMGVGWFMPSLMTMLGLRVKTHQQGRGAGLVKSANYLATPLCVVIAEPLFRAFGPRAPLAMVTVLSVGLLVLIGASMARRARSIGRQEAPIAPE